MAQDTKSSFSILKLSEFTAATQFNKVTVNNKQEKFSAILKINTLLVENIQVKHRRS